MRGHGAWCALCLNSVNSITHVTTWVHSASRVYAIGSSGRGPGSIIVVMGDTIVIFRGHDGGGKEIECLSIGRGGRGGCGLG